MLYAVGMLTILMVAVVNASELTVLVSGEELGHLHPVGCETDMGGLARRATLLHSLQQQHPSALDLHVGNLLDLPDTQSELLYQLALEALALMNYDVVCVGPRDLGLPVQMLRALQASYPSTPFVCSNLESAEGGRAEEESNNLPHIFSSALQHYPFAPYALCDVSSSSPPELLNPSTSRSPDAVPNQRADRQDSSGQPLRMAVVNLLSASQQLYFQGANPDLRLLPPSVALMQLKPQLEAQSDLVLVVFHGSLDEAQALAQTHPWLDIVLVVDEAKTPASLRVGNTVLAENPTQGASVGVLTLSLDDALQVRSQDYRTIPLTQDIASDPTVERLLELLEPTDGELTAEQTPERSVHLAYFHKPGCAKCQRAEKLLHDLKQAYPALVVERRNVHHHQPLLEAMGGLYQVPEAKRLTAPAVFVGEYYFLDELDGKGKGSRSSGVSGVQELRTRTSEPLNSLTPERFNMPHSPSLEAVIQHYLPTGVASRLPEAETHQSSAQAHILSRFHTLGGLTVAGAGLLDGINPCAFATLVFFFSYLGLVGRGRREILLAGVAFTLAVFVTYLLIGLGALRFLDAVRSLPHLTQGLYLLAALATLALAGLSFYDASLARRGRVKDITLQLPRSLKLRIHRVIRERVRTSSIVVGALFIGFSVSALELVCTGQVYLPTLTFVAGISEMRSQALGYLLLYNVMFVLPLLVVFACAYWGVTSVQLGGVLQRHLVSVKLGTGILLVTLALWLVSGVVL